MFEYVILVIPFCCIVLIVTPLELYGATNYRLMYCLFNMFWLTTQKRPDSLIRNVIICNKSFLTLWYRPCLCLSLPFEKSRFATVSLQWRHTSTIAFEITIRLTICSTACHDLEQKKSPNTLIGDKVICNTQLAFWCIVITVTPH